MTRANGSSGGATAKRTGGAGRAGEALETKLAPLALAFPARPVRPRLWRRIEAAIDADETAGPSPAVVRRDEGWRQFTRDVQIKQLWDDKTFMLRCAPGGVLPPHKHPRFEHCIVLEGDMIVSGETYRSGDYHGVPAHIGHKEITSRTGLLMLVRYE